MRTSKPTTQQRSWRRRILARATPVLCAYFATLLAIPVNAAITLPTDPLTTASRVPPNILFILDDSGSMAFETLENPAVPTICRRKSSGSCNSGTTITDQAYTGNAVYYNPATTYQPWVDASGALMTGGTSYGAVYGDFNLASGTTINLGSSSSCANFNRNYSSSGSSGNTQVCGGTQTFFVPKNVATTTASYLAEATNYYRYQITDDSTITRSEFGTVTSTSQAVGGYPQTGQTVGKNATKAYSVAVSSGVTLKIDVTTTANGVTYYVTAPSGFTACAIKTVSGGNGSSSCTVDTTSAGTYTVTAARSNNNNAPTFAVNATTTSNNRCGTGTDATDWINCTAVTPTGRSTAAEITNYATWFSYHRTRMKSAKAGAGSAFGELGQDVRVGYRTIWQRQPSGTRPGNEPTQAVPIPVSYNYGLFADPNGTTGSNNNRTQWYSRLYGTIGYNGTPLKGALQQAGAYYSSSGATGPYGPESGVDQYACRQNFSILTTDGYWNDDSNYTAVNEQDNASGSAITGTGGKSYTYTPSAPFASSDSNTLADVAMRYWKSDLRTDLDNIVPTTTSNPAFWQHMVTFGISIGLSGTSGYTSVASVPANYSSWPNPNDSEDADRIDDLLHAAVNGHGEFVAASNPAAFSTGLRSALSAITERTGSFSNVSANSTALDTGTRVYQASYVSGVWTGEVAAYAVSTSGVATTASWKASAGIPTTNRKVFTSDGSSGLSFPSSATATQLAALTRVGTANYPVTGENNAAYIAGTRTLELQNGGTLRNRNHLLGDIVSSSPAYVSDTNTLYVGANDGMLHAINAASGAELFGFIPNGISWASLNTLSRRDYAHRYFVDGPIVVSTRTQTPSKNILVGALGKGGKGLFALDVTNPAAFAATNFKWEVGGSDADMGLVQSKPFIAKLNDGSTALIVSNGINSTNGRAVLFVYNLETGELIKKIDTTVGSPTTDGADSNGLSAPVGWDADGNGTVDYVYAGDLLGNVWKFNLSATTPTTWAVANSAPLFSATYTSGTTTVRQPITGGITVALHPTTYKTWIFFGTGRLMTSGDLTTKSVQSMYGFVDDGTATIRSGDTANLTKRTTVVAGTIDGKAVRSFEGKTSLPASSKGWYVDLVTPPNATAEGERIVTDAQLLGDVLITSSVIPTASACQADGRGYLNALDAFTGTSTGPSLFDLDGDGQYTDETLTSGGKELPVGSVDLNVGMPTLSNLLRGLAVVGGSSGNTSSVNIRETRNVGRVSWREVKRGD